MRMLFKPTNEKLWDCWMYHEGDTYYLFYLRISAAGSWWDGISLATSSDLVHWMERGPVIEKSPEAKWLGTGMVWKVGRRYLMNFSEEHPDREQKVYFAESDDLFAWRRLDPVCEPDGTFYLFDHAKSSNPYPRWDSLGVFSEMTDGKLTYYAFVTASFQNDRLPGRNGTLALLESADGLNWRCLPSPLVTQGEYPNYEVPEHLEMNGRHYALFSTNSKAGFRYDAVNASGHTGGTYYLVSDQPLSGYRKPPHANRLIGQNDVYNVTANYVGRILRVGHETLFYHIWGDPKVDGAFGTVKRIVEHRPFELAVKYLPKNDLMIGEDLLGPVSADRFKLVKDDGALPPVKWSVGHAAVRFEDRGSSGALIAALAVPRDVLTLSDGRFVRCRLRIDDGTGAGLVIGEPNRLYTLFLDVAAGRIEFSRLASGWEANLVQEVVQTSPGRLEYHRSVDLRLIFRSAFLEVYLDDVYLMGVRTDSPIGTTHFGFYVETADCEFSEIRVNALR